VEEHQRRYLLADFEGLVADIREEADEEETVSAGNRHWIDNCDRLIGWLKGGPKPASTVREFLEERLEGFDDSVGYEHLAYEHDALAAAIEDLR
jgi:hypothetical protein